MENRHHHGAASWLLRGLGRLLYGGLVLLLWAGFARLGGEALSRIQIRHYQAGEQADARFMVAVRTEEGWPGSVTLRQWRLSPHKRPLLTESGKSPHCSEDIDNCTRLEIGADGVYRVQAGVPFVPWLYSEYRVTPQGEVVPLSFREGSFIYNFMAFALFPVLWFGIVRPWWKRRRARQPENLAAAGKAR